MYNNVLILYIHIYIYMPHIQTHTHAHVHARTHRENTQNIRSLIQDTFVFLQSLLYV